MTSNSCSLDSVRCSGSRDANAALHLKATAIFSIFAACVLGVSLPILGPRIFQSFNTKSKVFILLRSFSAGVILGTGFIHMLPDAFEALASSCLAEDPWHKFPFAGFTAMIAALATLLLDLVGTAFYKKKQPKDGAVACSEANYVTGGNEVAAMEVGSLGSGRSNEATMQLRYTVIAQVLELGMVAHSIIIGISLGTSRSPCTIRPLVAALTFHQLFEGLALGGCLCQAAFRSGSVILMSLVFSITTPTGIAIGLGISSVYDRNTKNALVLEGLLDAMSAGILVYMALVDLIATEFLEKQDEHSFRLQLMAYASLVCGAAAMALVAFWA